jgi:MIP family channel proteins
VSETYRWNAYLAEAVGTFLFFFMGIGAGFALFGESGAAVLAVIALAHGLALLVAVSAFGAVSGGHFNPAVTFGLWLASKIDGVRAAGYVIAQLVGAVLAALAIRYVFPPEVPTAAGLPALNAELGIDVIKGIVVEAGITMLLVTAVFGTAVDLRSARIGGIAIGLALTAGILMGGGLTGGAVNPARWFGPAVVAGDFTDAPVWIIGPLVGAAIIAVIYRFLFLPEAEELGAPESEAPGGAEPIE